MNISHEVFGHVLVLHAPEELTEAQVPTMVAALDNVPQRHVVIELDATETIDSMGLTCLLDIHDSLSQKGGRLKIATSNDINRKILRITKLDQTIEVYDSLVDAVKSFQTGL